MIPQSMESCIVFYEMKRADGRTDRRELSLYYAYRTKREYISFLYEDKRRV